MMHFPPVMSCIEHSAGPGVSAPGLLDEWLNNLSLIHHSGLERGLPDQPHSLCCALISPLPAFHFVSSCFSALD